MRAARLARLISTSTIACNASLAQLAEHALRKRMVVGSIPTGGWHRVGDGYLAAPRPHLARARAGQYSILSFFKAVMKHALHTHTESPQ